MAIVAQARALAPLEVIAVVAAIAYLVLAIRQNIWCWLGAGISTAIYVYLFFDAKLYMESALNLFYFAMAIYGWFVWYPGAPMITSCRCRCGRGRLTRSPLHQLSRRAC